MLPNPLFITHCYYEFSLEHVRKVMLPASTCSASSEQPIHGKNLDL